MPTTEPGAEPAASPGQERATSTDQLAAPGPSSAREQTPSQTIGPFFGYALPFPAGPQLVPAADPRAIRLHGVVLDGAGQPVPDALLELWQADERGRPVAVPGSRRRERADFTGFGRAPVGVDGSYLFSTLLPGAGPTGARFALLTVFARGLLHHLFTRVYFVRDGDADPADALLDRVRADRRATLHARQDGPTSHRFDVRLQGPDETVFLEYTALKSTALAHAAQGSGAVENGAP